MMTGGRRIRVTGLCLPRIMALVAIGLPAAAFPGRTGTTAGTPGGAAPGRGPPPPTPAMRRQQPPFLGFPATVTTDQGARPLL
jgi:hypothetical protein